jgi:hypothetical protein
MYNALLLLSSPAPHGFPPEIDNGCLQMHPPLARKREAQDETIDQQQRCGSESLLRGNSLRGYRTNPEPETHQA